jgi:hypothetical protein
MVSTRPGADYVAPGKNRKCKKCIFFIHKVVACTKKCICPWAIFFADLNSAGLEHAPWFLKFCLIILIFRVFSPNFFRFLDDFLRFVSEILRIFLEGWLAECLTCAKTGNCTILLYSQV